MWVMKGFHMLSMQKMTQRCCYSSSSPLTISSSFLTDLMEKYSFSAQQNRITLGSRLFRAVQYQALQPDWFGTDRVPRKFRSIHGLLSMHVWFLHKRLLVEAELGGGTKKTSKLLLQEELFDLFWNDTRSRIRALGVNELMVNKHLKDAQQMTFIHITQYDHAFSKFKDDPKKRFEVICDAVWRQVLLGGRLMDKNDNRTEVEVTEDSIDDDLIRRIGAYVEYQYDTVMFKLPDDYFEEGRIGWGNLPDFSDQMNKDHITGENKDFSSVHDKSGLDPIGNGWWMVLTDAGEPYYWNPDKNQTSWKLPTETTSIRS